MPLFEILGLFYGHTKPSPATNDLYFLCVVVPAAITTGNFVITYLFPLIQTDKQLHSKLHIYFFLLEMCNAEEQTDSFVFLFSFTPEMHSDFNVCSSSLDRFPDFQKIRS